MAMEQKVMEQKVMEQKVTEQKVLKGDDVTNPIANLEEVKGNYFEANTNVVFNKKAVDGNIFLTGDKVTIQGMVNGDVHLFVLQVVLEKDAAKILGKFIFNFRKFYTFWFSL